MLYQLWLRMRIPVLLSLAILGLVIWLMRDDPEQLYQQAQRAASQDLNKADQLLDRCLAARSDFPPAQLLRCRVLGRLGQWDESSGLFHLIQSPGDLPGDDLLSLGREAMHAHQTRLALSAVELARKPGPSRIPALQMLVQWHVQHDYSQRALEYCRELTRLTPDDPLPWQLIGAIQRKETQVEESVKAYRMALERQDVPAEQDKLREELVGALLDLGDAKAAREAIDPLVNRPEPSEAVLMQEGYLRRLEGKPDLALQTVDRLLAEHPAMIRAIYLRGLLRFDAGLWEQARDDLLAVIQREPFRKEAHFKLGQVYQRLGETAKANEQLASSQKLTNAAIELAVLKSQLTPESMNESKLRRIRELTRIAHGD